VLAKGDRVVVFCAESARRGGRSWSSPQVHVWTVKDGKATIFWGYPGDHRRRMSSGPPTGEQAVLATPRFLDEAAVGRHVWKAVGRLHGPPITVPTLRASFITWPAVTTEVGLIGRPAARRAAAVQVLQVPRREYLPVAR
jgi:hypothetical protein